MCAWKLCYSMGLGRGFSSLAGDLVLRTVAVGWCLHRRKIAPGIRRVLIAPVLLSARAGTRLISDAAMSKTLLSALALWI